MPALDGIFKPGFFNRKIHAESYPKRNVPILVDAIIEL